MVRASIAPILFQQSVMVSYKMMARTLCVLPMLLPLSVFAQSDESGLLLDDFDRSTRLQHWSFSSGTEFPGASGSLSLGPGHEGRGAILTYRFGCLHQGRCGHYVAAVWKAPSPLRVQAGAALSLWVRCPPEVRLGIRVKDQSDKTLQFHAEAPTLEHRAQGGWQRVVVPVSARSQGALKEIAILAEVRYLQPAQGSVAFDDLRLLSTPDMRFNLESAAAVVLPPEGASDLRARWGVNVHSLKDDRALDLVRDAGFGFVRTDLLWATLEKQAHYDFTPFDDLMRSLEARDLGVLWVLAYGHPNHGGKAPQSADDVAAYARYAAAAVAHFRGHKARFEIWNEPNAPEFLGDSQIYPELLRSALHAIRREDTAAEVTSGGVSGFDLPF